MSIRIPKGKLIAIGGNEDKGTCPEPNHPPKYYLNFFEFGILRRILQEMKGTDSRVEIITSASEIPEEVGENYVQAFAKLGCKNIGVMHIKSRKDAEDIRLLDRIRQADGVLFTGGDQSRLSRFFRGTEFLEILQERYQNEPFVIAGTSAGAMAMSKTMIYGGSSSNSLVKGAVKLTQGLAFINNVVIDTHFVTRGRFGRLAEAVAEHPRCIGIGLGEDTGVLITEGDQMETIGSGLVLIFDGHHIKHSTITSIEDGEPLSIENMVIHVLAKGNCYHLKSRSFHAKMPAQVIG
ncbi:cyanophycinase [Rhodocytophaga aerolata]|uniref:Cyanophycinase n=1 Tax=Rhodocytophaga aerolata TaxID=455078 RepID=A0ABT8R3G7_9BACT|nr:cyanophycinase [Rhodocytophaga aerolata]MDO1445823.1 cyanophycinase [Rhodocytophaga aerolata]